MKNFSSKSMRLHFLKTGAFAILLVLTSLQGFAELKIQTSATGLPVTEETVLAGEKLFKSKCQSCHQLNRIAEGPALFKVTERREMDWLIKWVRNNVELRQSGDPDADAIYKEFNGKVMTVFGDLTDDQIKSILMYTENGPLDKVVDEGQVVQAIDEGLFSRTNKILFFLSLLVFIVIILIIKTIDIVGKLTGKEVIPWNNVNAGLMLAFLIIGMIAGLYELSIHSKYLLLSDASSEHGGRLDEMMIITFIITGFVFFVTQFCLFYFAFKYREKKGVKALHYAHNDKLEIIWTAIPAVVLTVLVLGGLQAWQKINKAPSPGTTQIEVFAQQFAWQVRYPGADGELGNSSHNLISEKSNPLGIAVQYKAKEILTELEADLEYYAEAKAGLPEKLGELKSTLGGRVGKDLKDHKKLINDIESGKEEAFFDLQIRRRNTQIKRIKVSLSGEAPLYTAAGNDDIISDEIHIIKDSAVTFKLRSRDVIHSALMKEFRAQMNVVPGIPTQFTFTPITTTKQRRADLKNPEFDYHIICNKICGNRHFSMKIKIVVETKKEYDIWMAEQKATFAQEDVKEEVEAEPTEEPASEPTENHGEVAMN
jgi:cytochrome c oxidase subunit II